MADNDTPVVEATPVALELVKTEAIIPAPDSLIAGPNGIKYVDTEMIKTAGEFKRGTLFMSTSGGEFAPVTKAGLSTAKELAILCDDITVGENEMVCAALYFGGDFNGARVILPWETEESDHDAEIEEVKPYLRAQGIFLRGMIE